MDQRPEFGVDFLCERGENLLGPERHLARARAQLHQRLRHAAELPMIYSQVNPPKHAAGRPGRMSAGRAKSSEPTAGITPAELSLGEPKKRLDRSRRGSHAGLERIEVELFRHGVKIGWLDVHLHHNQGHISVGATLRIEKAQMRGSP